MTHTKPSSRASRFIEALSGAVLFASETGLAILAALWFGGQALGLGPDVLTVEAAISALIAGTLCVVWTVQFERNLRATDVDDSASETSTS